MTVNKVWEKLRKKNREPYQQFEFCVGFAVMLISSYLIMLYSPLIQRTLPEGGDSRMQVSMIFVVAAAGCVIFVIYAAGMFLRYKSKEVGVFLALGMDKGRIKKALLGEIARCMFKTAVIGIVAGSLMALLIGKVFEQIAKRVTNYSFEFTVKGITFGIMYALIITVVIMIMVFRFMKKTNIMDILNEQRKQEPIKKMVTSTYLVSGIALSVIGVFVGYILPAVVIRFMHHYLGGWTNIFYILVLIGLYRIMVYSVSCHRKGGNPQKYYRNMISYGMLKFMGRSIVRNMMVITLLVVGGLFSAFYIPLNNSSMQEILGQYEDMYSYSYTEDAKEVTQKEVEALAMKYNVEIKNYREARFLQVLGSGVNRDNVDKSGKLEEIYQKKYVVYECISASQYERLTGQKKDVAEGTYYMIQSPNVRENIFNHFDDMDQLYLDKEQLYMPMKYAGNLTYQCLVNGRGYDENARFVISDQDYGRIKAGTAQYLAVKQVLFDNTKGKQAVSFANELYKKFADQMSDKMNVSANYDDYKAESAKSDSMYCMAATYDPENPAMESDWKYEPNFQILKQEYGMLTYAVYLLLFLYVSVICLAAVGIISYARSQSVGLSSRQVFSDLEKLGANHSYLTKLLKKQIQKVYVLPTVLGSFVILVFEIMLLKLNDGVITKGEIYLIPVLMLVVGIVMLYQFGIYCYSTKKVKKILGLEE
ncbi:FtsX-like permease family protein [Anaeromicropila herbilytica]|uniref:ABC transporter permease n=1 Tax=Anaeromicropila herbilytica TaxID=2785025 RepID=A0A7R7EI22_9FIRM|nr:ABC transporter permease [Anaeromicropila herbilytica]BCN29105.1 ABC transporter permease [Anaeromicropila herbilytica]